MNTALIRFWLRRLVSRTARRTQTHWPAQVLGETWKSAKRTSNWRRNLNKSRDANLEGDSSSDRQTALHLSLHLQWRRVQVYKAKQCVDLSTAHLCQIMEKLTSSRKRGLIYKGHNVRVLLTPKSTSSKSYIITVFFTILFSCKC